jgi:NAD(P)-dependent dehydrogenase (short-subunit alcohol dehydrogenase family)
MRPIEEQTVLVTGATDGHGLEVVRRLVAGGATVLLHGRDEARADQARSEIAASTAGGEVRVVLADLSSLDAVRRLAAEVESNTDGLDALVNNAGVIPNIRSVTEDGVELTFAVNHLSHFLLTSLLLPLLRGSGPSRIVNVASIGQTPIDFDDVMLEEGYAAMRAYSQSKLAQIMFTFVLAERLQAAGVEDVTANALHPATMMNTKLARRIFGWAQGSVEQGAEATLRLVVDPELEGVSGRYFEGVEEAKAISQAYAPGARRRLWDLSEELAGAAPEV